MDPVEFLWDFGDFTSARANSRTITKRYTNPGMYENTSKHQRSSIVIIVAIVKICSLTPFCFGRYKLVVVASWGQMSVRSHVLSLVVQRAVKLNRLVHEPSVLQNHTVTVSCRVNVGTNLTFLWNFGDGTVRTGLSTEQHVFTR